MRMRWIVTMAIGVAIGAGALTGQEATSELDCGPGNYNGCSWDGGTGGVCDVTHVECGFLGGGCEGTTEAAIGSGFWCNTFCKQTYACRPASIPCNSDVDCGCAERCLDGVCDEETESRCGSGPPGDGGGDDRVCASDRECPFGQRCFGTACCNKCVAGDIWVSPIAPSPTVKAQCTDFPLRTCVELNDCPIDERCTEVHGLDDRVCVKVDVLPAP